MSLSKEKEKLLQRLKNPRLRRKEGLFLVEGIRSAREFLGAGIPVRFRFALVSPRLGTLQDGPEVMNRLEASRIPLTALDDDHLSRISDTENPQGILLVGEEPREGGEGPFPLANTAGPRILILDGIQDPGNVGTLVRGARAFGLDGVVALDGTSDPWGPKAVRASAGALAHIPLFRMTASGALGWLEQKGLALFVAEAGGKDLRTVRGEKAWALAVGNEGVGTRPELRAVARETLSIPMAPGADSLNVAVAGSILLFALSAWESPASGGSFRGPAA